MLRNQELPLPRGHILNATVFLFCVKLGLVQQLLLRQFADIEGVEKKGNAFVNKNRI